MYELVKQILSNWFIVGVLVVIAFGANRYLRGRRKQQVARGNRLLDTTGFRR